jgi:hypothetical protein
MPAICASCRAASERTAGVEPVSSSVTSRSRPARGVSAGAGGGPAAMLTAVGAALLRRGDRCIAAGCRSCGPGGTARRHGACSCLGCRCSRGTAPGAARCALSCGEVRVRAWLEACAALRVGCCDARPARRATGARRSLCRPPAVCARCGRHGSGASLRRPAAARLAKACRALEQSAAPHRRDVSCPLALQQRRLAGHSLKSASLTARSR